MKTVMRTCLMLAAISLLPLVQMTCAQAVEQTVPLVLKLPSPKFVGTRPDQLPISDVEPSPDEKKGPAAIQVPAGCVNLAARIVPTTSDTNASLSKLAKITDGNKEADEEQIVLLRKGVQQVQLDLKKPANLYAIVVWHAHDAAKVYRGVVVQIADDAAFTQNVRTLLNNDTENKAGQGVGTDKQYFESHWGKRVEVKGQKAQFVRLYSRGSTESALNEYTEIEVWGKPAP